MTNRPHQGHSTRGRASSRSQHSGAQPGPTRTRQAASRLLTGAGLLAGLWAAAQWLTPRTVPPGTGHPAYAQTIETERNFEPIFEEVTTDEARPVAASPRGVSAVGGQADGAAPLPVSLVGVATKLGLVLACIIVAGVVLRHAVSRRSAATDAGSPVLSLEETLELGNSRQLVLVEADGRRLLVGMDPQGVTLVADLSRPAETQWSPELLEEAHRSDWFWKGSEPNASERPSARRRAEREEAAGASAEAGQRRKQRALLAALAGRAEG